MVVTWFVLAECRLLDRKLKGNNFGLMVRELQAEEAVLRETVAEL